MQGNRNPHVWIPIVVLLTGMLACNLSAAQPTVTPPPTPTDVPLVATDTPEPTPPPEPTAVPATATTAAGETAPIQILMVNGYLDTFDSWNIVGLVQNNTDRIIDSIEIEVELFDVDSNSLFVDTTFADLFNIAPGEVTPFSYTVFEDLPEADNFVATVVGNSTSELERAYPDVTNTNIIHDDGGDTHIMGEFVNNSDQPIEINSLAAATFDASGQILGANAYSVSTRYINPGGAGPFRVTITGADTGTDAIDSYEIFIDAEVAEPLGPFGLTISDAYDYTDTFDNFHLVGEVTNDGEQTLNVSMIAGIYDAEGKVLDASDISLPINALPPGETLPYDFDFWGPLNYTEGLLSEADTYTIQVDAYWTWETSTELLVLTTQNDDNSFDEFGGEFNGQVVNDSAGPIENITVVIFLRDLTTDQVVATGYDFIFEELADGATAEYTVFMDVAQDFDVDSAEYYTLVVGQRP